jgi:hypothetical protein
MSAQCLEAAPKYRAPDELAILVSVHHNTVIRWLRDGVRFSDGKRRRPEALRTPGGWRVREDHFWAFLEAVKADRTRPDADEAPEVPKPVRSQRVARLNERLAAAGF